MEEPELVSRIARRSGLDEQSARRAATATLTALGGYLRADEADALASHLPARWVEILRDAPLLSPQAEAFYHHIAQDEGVVLGFAKEHAQVVCGVVAEAVGEPGRMRLRQALPEPLMELVVVPTRAPAPSSMAKPEPPIGSGEGRDLASGRPGSHQPISDASAEAGSVSRTDETEAERTTLSRSRPGSRKPLSDSGG